MYDSIPFRIKTLVFQVFDIERHGERKRFRPFRDLNNRMLLWHGSRTTNYAGILSQGLRIAPPEAPVVSVEFTGFMAKSRIYPHGGKDGESCSQR